jgi:two-component system sensor histidine kinase YesM
MGKIQASRYGKRIYRKHLWMAFIPASFFIVLGVIAIYLSQGYVTKELDSLSSKNLWRVGEAVDLFLSEADSLALGLSTDPELAKSMRSVIKAHFATLDDLKSFKSILSSLVTAVNSRPYLYSILVSTKDSEGYALSSSEGFVKISGSEDREWLAGASGHEADVRAWTKLRSVAPFDALDLRVGVFSLYRNLLGSGGLLEREGLLVVNVDLSYLDRFLSEQSQGTEGSFVVVDRESGGMIAGDRRFASVAGSLPGLASARGAAFGGRSRFVVGGERFVVTSFPSSRLPVSYVLLVPEAAFNRIPRRIAVIAAAFALVALVIGAALTVASARSNFRLLEGIISIIEAAGSGSPLPHPKESRDEALNYVTFSVLRTFLEHDYFKVRLSEREFRMRALELLALQAQMNPHFLFNTLAAIDGKALSLAKGPSELSRMVELLSSMLGYALSDPSVPITLRDEVAHASAYFEIQKLRFGERLRCEWDIGEEAESVSCVKLLLQPLVENSIEHGFVHRPEGGTVRVSAHVADGTALVSVSDDGDGMQPGRLEEIRALIASEDASVERVGLVNTAKRLVLAYGPGASASISSAPGEGTEVTLRFPSRPPSEGPWTASGTLEDSSRSIS